MSRQRQPRLDRRAFLGRSGAGAGVVLLGGPGLSAAAAGRSRPGSGRRRAAERWLKAYRKAWVQRDPDAAAALFTQDAVYQEHPFRPAYVGRDAIRGYWETATAAQSDVELRYGELVVARRKAAVEWWVNLRNGGAEITLAGEFLLTFARGGLCRSLREYWFVGEGRLSPPPGWGQ